MSTVTPTSLPRWMIRQVPTFLALIAIAGVGAWGMSTGWKLPRLSGQPVAESNWCTAHNVPEDVCVECKPELMPRVESVGWCRTHGVHECTLCHPELAQLDHTATVSAEDRARAAAALAFAPRPDNGRKDKLHERRIQFASIDAFDRSGVEVSPAYQGKVEETAPVHGEITNDPARVTHVSSRSAGPVWRVFRHVGDSVQAGELLGLVDAAAVGQAKAEYLQWHAQLDVRTRLRAQMDPAVVPAPTLTTADAAVREARIKLTTARQALINLGLPLPADDFKGLSDDELVERVYFLGIPPEEARGLDARTASNNLLPIRSPINGTITSRDVVAGEVVEPNKMLFEVVDHSTVWLTVGVRNEDVRRIRPGQTRVRFEPDGHTGAVEGAVAWISSAADPRSRMVKVRVNLPNPDGKLRANTFGHGQVILREEPNAVLLPNEAIHVEGGNHYLFVRDRDFRKDGTPKVFHTRTVRIGARDERNTEVIAGVLPDELVATRNSAMLMAELLRGKIGEG